MKIKHLIIVSLILTILTMGVVSASDDINETLTLEDEVADDVATFDVDEITGEDNSLDNAIGEPEDEEPGDYDDVSVYMSNVADTTNDNVFANVYDGKKLNGTVSISVDAQQCYKKSFSTSDNKYSVKIYAGDLNLANNLKTGKHNVVLTYLKNDDPNNYTQNKQVTFIDYPEIDWTRDISTGETAVISINAHGGNGKATLYKFYPKDDLYKVIATGTISNGKCKILVPGLTDISNDFCLNMTIDGQEVTANPYIYVKENTAGYSASVSPKITVGSNVVVKFSGLKSNEMVEIYVDGALFRSVKYNGGSLSENIAGLSVGQHHISIGYEKGNDFYFKTFTVDVAKKPTIQLTLKKVSIKKSAKKLVLQATLKINKKIAKGKVVTFKFNGKTYKAKTNKKGVAKVTIKKAVLKKLKIGKKIKYQAKYSTKTVIKTAKVKK